MRFKSFSVAGGVLLLLVFGCDSGSSPTGGGGAGGPTLSVNNQTAVEGNTVTFTVTLSETLDTLVIFTYATGNGTATQPGDYQTKSGTDTITAGETSTTVTVVTSNDSDEESCETFSLTISNPTNAEIGDAAGLATIYDNDPIKVTFESDVHPILLANCSAVGCHSGSNPQQGLSMSSYSSIVTHKNSTSPGETVVPCDPLSSNLYLKTTPNPPFGDRMPQSGPPYLSIEQQELIKNWIRQGAQNN